MTKRKGGTYYINWAGAGSLKVASVTSLIGMLFLLCLSLYGIHYISTPSTTTTSTTMTGTTPLSPSTKKKPTEEAKDVIRQLRNEFETRYGSYSKTLLERGVDEYGSIEATASRMVEASIAGRPFVMAFSGYSVTVGRGNFFNQSFPFEVQRILNEPMQKLLGISLVVRNAAIGGIPSFPYSFCLEHFVGSRPDVLSWDYSMNEGNSEAVLEAFVRQAMQQLSTSQPMIIMLDKNARRKKLLQEYTEKGLLADAIAVGRKEDVLNDKTLAELEPLPPGFQNWDEFGAPPSCPGHGAWHPKRQEHSMIGWMIAMHFVKVLERAHDMLHTSAKSVDYKRQIPFPKPLGKMPDNDPEVNELLFGHKVKDSDSYFMKDLSCRTSFVPASDETKTIPSIVVSGLADANLDIMVDRTEDHYKHGWVLDVSTVERNTKRKVENCGGLGYVDMKIAMYGIPQSGKVRLWLPFEGPSHDDHAHDGDLDMDAKHWFDDLIFCEANEKRPDEACKLHQDLTIIVGGVEVPSIHEVNGAAEYLKRKTCVNVGIPIGATITKLSQVKTTDGQALSKTDLERLGGGVDENGDDRIGIVVDVTAKPRVSLAGGACCLSHVVWEMH